MEFTLLFAVLTAVATMGATSLLLGRSGRIAGIERPVDVLIGAAVIGMFSGRVAAMVIDGVNPFTNPGQIILVRAGVDTRVASVTAVLALLWMTRSHLPQIIDAVAPIAAAGLGGWHAGCLWRGTCLGAVSDLPWAYGIEGSSVTRHPVELYAALGMAVVALVVSKLTERLWFASSVTVAGVALVRLVTEPIRPSLSGGPVLFYAMAAMVGLAGVFVARIRPAAPPGSLTG
ncbi:MAG: prolipoprotein diacylglyceryl transferase [Acidimicrobiia bacterium]|nr:prolipoprotein diacylglyceryl transferase [Acidimicrobiia bacterium]